MLRSPQAGTLFICCYVTRQKSSVNRTYGIEPLSFISQVQIVCVKRRNVALMAMGLVTSSLSTALYPINRCTSISSLGATTDSFVVSIPRLSAQSCHLLGKINALYIFLYETAVFTVNMADHRCNVEKNVPTVLISPSR